MSVPVTPAQVVELSGRIANELNAKAMKDALIRVVCLGALSAAEIDRLQSVNLTATALDCVLADPPTDPTIVTTAAG